MTCLTMEKEYEVIVELPGIDKDNIRIKAMDDSIEISAEQSQEEDKQKKNFVYSQRGYSSFYLYNPLSRGDPLFRSYC